MNDLFKAVLQVRQEIATIVKDANSPLAKYSSLHNIMTELQPLLNKNNLVIYHEFKKNPDNDVLNVVTNLVYVGENTTHTLKVEFPVKEIVDSQKMGAAMTYARRYNINALFNLTFADEKSDDDFGDSPKKATKTVKTTPQTISF